MTAELFTNADGNSKRKSVDFICLICHIISLIYSCFLELKIFSVKFISVQMCRSIHVLLSLFSRIFCVRTCALHFGFKFFVKLHLKLSCLINCTIFPRSSMNKKIKGMYLQNCQKNVKNIETKIGKFFLAK